MQNAQYLLMVHEQRLEQLNSISTINTPGASTNFASNNAVNQSRGGSANRGFGSNRGDHGRGKNRRWNSNNRLSCQLCNKTGHGALQCYRRFDQGWHGAPQVQHQPHAMSHNNFSPPQTHYNQ
ncbi:hypothetical protein ACOSQ2_017502 [Xanthoceras sorbifolium]